MPDDAVEIEERLRTRLAEALHDGPIQELTAAQLFLDALVLSGGDPDGSLGKGLAMLSDATDACRAFMDDLAPGLEGVGELEARIRRLARRTDADAGVRTAIPAEFAAAHPDLALLVYRSVSELLDNVRRHADGRLRELAVSAQDGHVEVVVVDAGPGGCETAESESARGGLDRIAHRVEAAGGRLRIVSDGNGTRVTVSAPIPPASTGPGA